MDYYSISDVARAAGVSVTTVSTAVKQGRVKRPTLDVGKRDRQFTLAEADELIHFFSQPRPLPAKEETQHITISELCRISGIPMSTMTYKRSIGLVPQPDQIVGGRKCYLRSEVPELLKAITQPAKQGVSLDELCKITERSKCYIQSRVDKGLIPGPTKEAGSNRHTWQRSDLPKIMDLLKKPLEKKSRLKEFGLYSQEDMAKELNLNRISIQHHVKKGHIPKPTRTQAGWTGLYYSQEEADQVKAYFANRPSSHRSSIRISKESKDRLEEMSRTQSKSVATIVEELLSGLPNE